MATMRLTAAQLLISSLLVGAVCLGEDEQRRAEQTTCSPDEALPERDTALMQLRGERGVQKVTAQEDNPLGLTPEDIDYLTDASNPLDKYEASKGGAEGAAPDVCCEAMTAACLACKADVTIQDFCKDSKNSKVKGCNGSSLAAKDVGRVRGRAGSVADFGKPKGEDNAEEPFQCRDGFDNWEKGWSMAKRGFCCKTEGRGCGKLNCSAGIENRELGWSYAKKAFCAAWAGAPARGSFKAPVGDGAKNATCITRSDSRVSSWSYKTSPAGTPCVFGKDPRDEGFHCIMEDGQYGSYGWCWTDSSQTSWGSCSEACPLFGQAKILEDRIRSMSRRLAEALEVAPAETTTTTTNTTTSTVPDPSNATSEPSNLTMEAPPGIIEPLPDNTTFF